MDASAKFKRRQELFDSYQKERAQYCSENLELSSRYDHWLLTLSGGALGISLAFLKDIASKPPQELHLLGLAWAFLTFSLLMGFLSLLTACEGVQKQITNSGIRYKRMEKAVRNDEDEFAVAQPSNFWIPLTHVSNWIAAFALIVGTSFLCSFSYVNISQNLGGAKKPQPLVTNSVSSNKP